MKAKGFFFFMAFIAWPFHAVLQTTIAQVDSLLALAHAETDLSNRMNLIRQAEAVSDGCLSCKARCLGEKGLLFCQQGQYEAGYDLIFAAIQLRRQLGDSLRVAGNFTNIAVYKHEEGKYVEAISSATTAQLILEAQHRRQNTPQLRDTLVAQSLATTYNTLSNIHSDFGNYEQSLQFALKSLEINQKIGRLKAIYDAYYTLANRYFLKHLESGRQKDADSAALLYQRFLQFAENNPEETNPLDIADLYHNLASLAISRNDYPAARQALAQAQARYEAEESIEGLVDVEILKANVAIGAEQDYRSGMMHMRRVQQLLSQTPVDTFVQLEIYNLLSECFEAFGQFDSALVYSKLAEKLNEQLFRAQQQQFNSLDRAYLEKRNELGELEIEKSKSRQRQWAFIAAIFGLLSILGALVWRQREMKQKQRIAQQNQAIEDTLKDAQVRFLQGIIEGQQIERKETKDLLHNDIANTVLSLSYEIENTQPIHPVQKNWVTELQKLATHTRKLSHQKGGIIHEVGLYEGIQDLIKRIRRTNLLEVEFVSNLDQKRLEPAIEIEIWHIVQEMLSNTLKHARASRIELSIETDKKSVYILYQDNGIGFDYQEMLSRKKSLGLQSIQDKCQHLGVQTTDIITAPGCGMTVSIEIPIQKIESL